MNFDRWLTHIFSSLRYNNIQPESFKLFHFLRKILFKPIKMNYFKYLFLFLVVFIPFISISQKCKTNAEILEGIKKLNVLGSVLYIAAHPDDENTRLISYLSKDMKLNTAYLSLTRGDGGQNLIGSDLDEKLGVIRTNELLEARKIDGGNQFFSRANDFGYSKNAEETFTIWNYDSVLCDVIRVIREFKPDVIINRFDHRSSGKTHGHHTASAILGLEASKYSNSPLFKKDALKGTEMHLVSRIYFNTSWFFFGGKEKFDAMDKSNLYKLDVGTYLPAYGYSTNEIAAQSRSMHKSQGFGINSSRGSQLEYFERLDQPKDQSHSNPFEGLDLSWTRINGGGNVKQQIDSLILFFDIQKPWLSIPRLQKIQRYIEDLPEQYWTKIKLQEVIELILDCAGFYAEATTDKNITTGGDVISINAECIVRNPVEARLVKYKISTDLKDSLFQFQMIPNQALTWKTRTLVSNDNGLTSPFWLWNGRHNGYYKVDAAENYNRPVTKRNLSARFDVEIFNKIYQINREIIYKNDDPVLGEVRQNLDVLPGICIKSADYLIIPENNRVHIKINVKAYADNQTGALSLKIPSCMNLTPWSHNFQLEKNGDEKIFEFFVELNPTCSGSIEIPVLINNQVAFTHEIIKYPHIPWQNILLPTVVKIINKPIVINKKKRIAYIEGAGDFIDEALEKMNYPVSKISPSMLKDLRVDQYNVLIFGIRALNTNSDLKNCKNDLLRYMNQGGKVIFQYNTTAELITDDFAPDTLAISRDRVTDEYAQVRILKPDHPLFNQFNKISSDDFENWVQERGLYFPGKYSTTYDELLAMADPNEKELRSGILIKKLGKGYFVYSSLAWFRQLKAGVPGAYRIFSNLVSFE